MAKRDRDTGIWKDPFYRGLPPLYKCFWDFLNDDCDNAGVWCVDLPWAKICIGKKIDVDKALELFGSRVQVFDGGRKWHVKTFVFEKLGFTQLNPAHKFQKSIMDLLTKHKIDKIKGYPDTLQSVKDMGKDKEKDKGKDKGNENEFEKISISENITSEIVPRETHDFSQPDTHGDEIVFPIDTPIIRDHWEGWKKSRWENHNARYGIMGEQAALKQLHGLDEAQIVDTLLKAIAGKWKNLYPEKSKQPNGTSKTKHERNTSSLVEGFAKRYGSDAGK